GWQAADRPRRRRRPAAPRPAAGARPRDTELVLDDIASRRGGRTAFAGLSFRVPERTAALVRGPTGSGKSSLLRIVAGLLPPAAGDVRLGELSLSRDPGALQERVAFAGHLDAVKPALTVGGNLAAWAGIFDAARERTQ